MESIIIEHSKHTPKVTLDQDTGLIRFEGVSRPEDTIAFFDPITTWIEEYLKTPNKETIVEFALSYHNSSTAKIICQIMNMFEPIHNNGNNVTIKWYYFDDDTREAGEDYMSILNIPFELIKM